MNTISKAVGAAVIVFSIVILSMGDAIQPSLSADRPFSTADLFLFKWIRPLSLVQSGIRPGNTGGQFSAVQFRRYRCQSEGNPATYVDMSCDDSAFGQNFSPDNEIAIAVDPGEPTHLVAGSNDGYYRFNNSSLGRPDSSHPSTVGQLGSTAKSQRAREILQVIPRLPLTAPTT